MELKYYSETDQRLGLVPNEGDLCALSLAGEPQAVDRALHWLLRLWSVYPVSTVVWDTVDGCAPQEEEPARATVLVRMREFEPAGHERTAPKRGPAPASDAGQALDLEIS